VPPEQVDAGSYDPDGVIVDMILIPSGPYQLGQTAVMLIVTDDEGDKDTCNAFVTVEDNTDPVLTCPENIYVDNELGQCYAVVNFQATATDNCDPDVNILYDPQPGSQFPVGVTTVNVIATDNSGNQDFCDFTVTVNDMEPPVAICPDDMNLVNDPGECGAVASFAIDAIDNCPGVTVQADPPSGSFFDVGETEVEVIATDDEGNADTCYFSVTVTDSEPPTVVCPADTLVTITGADTSAFVVFSVQADDNCQLIESSCVPPSGSEFFLGVTTVMCTATDHVGFADTCYFAVMVGRDISCGDPNHDGISNISDAVYLIDWIFGSGPAPNCGP
jgi:hypothetical protein